MEGRCLRVTRKLCLPFPFSDDYHPPALVDFYSGSASTYALVFSDPLGRCMHTKYVTGTPVASGVVLFWNIGPGI